jgi:hypothetical protein
MAVIGENVSITEQNDSNNQLYKFKMQMILTRVVYGIM